MHLDQFVVGLLFVGIAHGFLSKYCRINLSQKISSSHINVNNEISADLRVKVTMIKCSPEGANFFTYKNQPSKFYTMQQWKYIHEFLHRFGSIYSGDDEVKNEIYLNRKHYPYQLSLHMRRIAESYGDDDNLKLVGYHSRLFVECALSLFAPQDGWDQNTKMLGKQIQYLRIKYSDSENFMQYVGWCEQINRISRADVHAHAKGGVTEENRAFLVDYIFLIADYASINLEKKFPRDAERALNAMKSKHLPLWESQNLGGSQLLGPTVNNFDAELHNDFNWAGQIRLRVKDQILAQEMELNDQFQSETADIDAEADAIIAETKKEREAKIAAVSSSAPPLIAFSHQSSIVVPSLPSL